MKISFFSKMALLTTFLMIVCSIQAVEAPVPTKEELEQMAEWEKEGKEISRRVDEIARKKRIQEAMQKFEETREAKYLNRLTDPDAWPSAEIAVPWYMKMFDAEPGVRFYILNILPRYGAEAKAAVPRLLEIIENSSKYDPEFYRRAIQALGVIAPEDPGVIDALTRALSREIKVPPTPHPIQERIDIDLLESLEKAGPKASVALEFLGDIPKLKTLSIRLAAFRARGEIEAVVIRDEDIPKLLRNPGALTDAQKYALLKRIPDTKDLGDAHVADLIAFLKVSPDYVQQQGLVEMARMKSSRPEATRFVLDILAQPPLNQGNSSVLWLTFALDGFRTPILNGSRHPSLNGLTFSMETAALGALLAQDGRDVASVPLFVEALRSEDSRLRQAGARVLAKYGAKAAPAVPELIRLLGSADEKTDMWELGEYVTLLREIGPAAAPAKQTLLKLLPIQSKVYRDRMDIFVKTFRPYILLTLVEFGFPDEAIPYLYEFLNGKESAYAFAVGARVAASRPDQAEKTIPLMLPILQKDIRDRGVAFKQYTALGQLVPMDDHYTSGRREVLRALRKLAPQAKKHLPELMEIVKAGRIDQQSPQAFSVTTLPQLNEELLQTITAIRESK